MRARKTLSSILALILIGSSMVGQAPTETAEEKAKKKKEIDERVVQMIDQSIADAAALRLAQNRAIVLTLAGDLYWKFDNKRSRELFRQAAGEIVSYNAEVEREKLESVETAGPVVEMFDPND